MARKKSPEKFKEEFNKYYGRDGEYIQLSEYIDSKTPIKVRHETCGYEYYSPPRSILNGRKCRNRSCYLTKSNEQFKKEFIQTLGGEYKLLSEYKRHDYPVKVYHSICGNTYETTPKTILSGSKCPKCNILSKTKSHEEYARDFKDIYGNEYSLLSRYINGAEGVKVKHNVCGREYNLRAKNLYRKPGCLHCYGTPKKTTEQFKQEMLEKRGPDYELISEYKTMKEHVQIKHKCGNIMNVYPLTFIYGVRCTECYGFKVRTEEEIEEILVNNGYTLVGDYVNIITPVAIKHDRCGYTYKYIMSNFLSGLR